MTNKDYYKILGVDENASTDELKKAYRRLAKEYHPDRNKGDQRAEERFKEVNEAFSILGDANKRKKYDQFRKYGPGHFGGMSWEDILQQFGVGGSGFGGSEFGGSRGTRTQDFEVHFGFDDIFDSMLGGRGAPGRRAGGRRSRTNASDPLQQPDNDTRVELALNLAQVVLGTKVRIRTPRGSTVDLRIPPGTQPGKTFRLKGMGREGGDLYVIVKVQIPTELNSEQRELLEKFARLTGMKF